MNLYPVLLNLGIIICIYIILCLALNIALGVTGLLNLGHIAFFAIGAYTSAILTKAGLHFIVACILAGVVASLFGLLLIYATKKLKGDYLALATLGFSFVISSFLVNLRDITGGPDGIRAIPKPNLLLFTISTREAFFIFALILAGITYFKLKRIVASPFGRLLAATRDDELGLRVLGKNTQALKIKSMMLSAYIAGIAGSLFAHYITFINPNSFTLSQIIFVLTIVIVGGIASLEGTIIASIILLIIPELLRFLPIPSFMTGPLEQVVYAVILITILLIKPRGLLGKIDLHTN